MTAFTWTTLALFCAASLFLGVCVHQLWRNHKNNDDHELLTRPLLRAIGAWEITLGLVMFAAPGDVSVTVAGVTVICVGLFFFGMAAAGEQLGIPERSNR